MDTCYLKIIHENKIKRLNNIYIDINKINTMRNTLQLNNINNISNITLEIKNLADMILTNCTSICNFSKEFAKITANEINNIFFNEIYYNEIYNEHVLYKNVIIDNICEKMLTKEFEKIIESHDYKQYMDKISMLHKYAIALFDKLEVICSL
jgi:hypothetical protein